VLLQQHGAVVGVVAELASKLDEAVGDKLLNIVDAGCGRVVLY